MPATRLARVQPRQAGHRVERATELTFLGDVLLPPEAAQQLVLLRELVPLLAGRDAGRRELAQFVTLADHQLTRPRHSWSMVAESPATRSGSRTDSTQTPVWIRTRLVDAAMAPRITVTPADRRRAGVALTEGDRVEPGASRPAGPTSPPARAGQQC